MAVSPLEALNLIVNSVKGVNKEVISIENSLGRVVAQDIYAPFSLPRFANSAMDGYAVIYGDDSEELQVTDKIFAGDNKDITLSKGQCVKIMTGARIPKNCTAVVPQEDVELLSSGNIKIPKIKENQNIRFIGEDIKEGEKLIVSGEEINFAKITLLVSMGITHIEAYQKPKVVVFASGDELKQYYEKIESHQIYNSNTPSLVSRCKELGCDVTFTKTSSDSLEALQNIIKNALRADFIITTGGVSVGEADFTKGAFGELGFETIFDGIIIKPGKPTVFGKIGDTYVLNLPGNPLAAGLIFEIFGKIAVESLKGSSKKYHSFILSKLGVDIKNKAGRITIMPGFFDGECFVPALKMSPGMVSVLSGCNSLVALDSDVADLKQNSVVKVLPINWNFLANEYKDFLTR
ncbi:MAG: molybdopterin molybdotransferase MoeA [Arcobacteraceae bacterium]